MFDRLLGNIGDVSETVAVEEGQCACTGQIVRRWYLYPASAVPDVDYGPDPEHMVGRDLKEDALIDFGPIGGDWQEVSDIAWIEEGSPDATE